MFKVEESGRGYTDDHILTPLWCGRKVDCDWCAWRQTLHNVNRASFVGLEVRLYSGEARTHKSHNGIRFCLCHWLKKHCAPIRLWVLQVCHIYSVRRSLSFRKFRGSWTSKHPLLTFNGLSVLPWCWEIRCLLGISCWIIKLKTVDFGSQTPEALVQRSRTISTVIGWSKSPFATIAQSTCGGWQPELHELDRWDCYLKMI